MWDIRKKGCIFGYKGHNSTVNSIRFSPDGQWIASGGDDNLVKVSQVNFMWRMECPPEPCSQHEFNF